MIGSTCIPLNALYEAVLLTDQELRVKDCNAWAKDVLRAPSVESIIGRSAVDILADHDLASEFPTDLRERLTTVPFIVVECRIVRDDGTPFFAETVIRRIDDSTLLFMIRDITAKTESFHRLEEANERLRMANRDRMEFVSNVSHELRTPLTSMSYALANMRHGLCGSLPEKAVSYIEHLQMDVRRLLTTVNDILDLRQMEAGTLVLHKTCVSLTRLLGEAVDALAIQAEVKRQTLIVPSNKREIYIEADAHKIERVLFNVLSNAIKYTQEGGTIHAEVLKEKDNAIIRVDDNGIGIPPEALPRITQRYFRVGDQVAGTGLGLAIVREIAELHGGSFHIASPVPGTSCGTRVTVTLPGCAGPLTVIVSGDEAFISKVSAQEEACGNSVFVDRQGIDLAEECAKVKPASFVLDGALPESALNDWICQIRGASGLARLPVVVLASDITPARKEDLARMHVAVRPRPQ